MWNDLAPLLKHLPPKTSAALSQAVTRCSEALEMGPDWVQRWIGFTIVADALASQSLQGSPAFEFKGGAAIELRMRQLRRATGETSPPASDTPVWKHKTIIWTNFGQGVRLGRWTQTH